jgi:hypothetical protein
VDLVYFLSLLFDPGESSCFSKTSRGTIIENITSISYLAEEKKLFNNAFFSINPMDPTKTRADSSVTKYRNILVEMDKMPLEQQDQYITEIGLPFSTAVYSGSKSIHYIISLEEELSDEQLYRALVKRVYKAVGMQYVDQTCKNPSRFSRLPGHLREETGNEQKLLAIKGRIPYSKLEEWLLERGAKPEEVWDNLTPEARSTFKNPSRLYIGTKNFLMYGAPAGEWNVRLFKAAADMYRCGYNKEEIFEGLLTVTGTLDFGDHKTIESAIKNEMGKCVN